MKVSYPIAGIDISSTTLDSSVLEENGKFAAASCPNTKTAAKKLAKSYARMKVALVVIESTGGYETAIMAALAAEGVAFARVNPRQVRDFAKGIGKLAKTDPIDARVLALFGERARPRVTTLPTAQEAHLKALSLRRRQLVDARVVEKNHARLIDVQGIKASIARMIEALDEEIESIEEAIAELIAGCDKMRERQELLESIPCIAAATSVAVIAELPELGSRSTSVLKALVGVAPFNADSGGVRANATSRAAGPRFVRPSTCPPRRATGAIRS